MELLQKARIKLPVFWASRKETDATASPFWVMVEKEITDHMRGWRYNVLLLLMALICIGSLYTALMSIRSDAHSTDTSKTVLSQSFFFLKLFTASNGSLPPFISFVGFIGPLIGIGLGFDAINSERNKGTLTRVLSQPVPRDAVINAKFTAALIVIGILFFALGFLVMGLGLLLIGVPPVPEEFIRMVLFLLLSVIYVSFWLNLSILFSVKFRQAATSAICSMAVWLFFSIFYGLILNLINNATAPTDTSDLTQAINHVTFIQFLSRFSPSQLYNEATTTLLMPSVRSLGPLTMDQVVGAIPGPLPLGQSILLVWPQLTGLIAATLVCFGVSYYWFMRQEIRSR